MKLLLLSLLLSFGAAAEVVKEKKFNFTFHTQNILKGQINYSFMLSSPKKMKKRHDFISELDAHGWSKIPKSKLLAAKFVYVVEKPVGFFDHEHMGDEKYQEHVLGEQRVQKQEDGSFTVEVPGSHKYKMTTYYDSDDISTLPKNRIINAVSAVRKMDIITQSASSIVVYDTSDYTAYQNGLLTIHSYIPLKENKTMVITYIIGSVKDEFAKPEKIEKSLVGEISAQRDLIKTFEAK